MIEIDGSIGFGQVLRTAIAFSSLLLKPVKIFNIRIRRPRPGLRPQHLMGIKVAAEFCAADIKGAKIGSTTVTFVPKRYNVPEYKRIDIGTAGSVTLLLQSILPLLIFSGKEVKLEIIGGTDVKGASTTIWFQHVFAYFMRKIGVDIEANTFRHGFYPKGGGRFFVKIRKLKEKLDGLSLLERGEVLGLNLWSIASKNLQKAKVAERQLKGFKENFYEEIPLNAYFRYVDSFSPGTSINAHLFFENCVLGNDALGEKGKRAENVGKECAEGLKKSYESDTCLDRYMSDQILPFIVLANGKSKIKVEEFTEHVIANIKVIEMFADSKFEINKKYRIVKVKGIGLGSLL